MPVNISIFYAQADAILLDKLKSHLRPLQKQNLINFLSDQNISAGASWKQEIEGLTNITHIYLFLVSQYSLNLDYFYSTEVLHIVERHDRGEIHSIPIILRPVYYQRTALAKLQVLPTDAKPIVTWPDLDEAFLSVASGIKIVALEEANRELQRENQELGSYVSSLQEEGQELQIELYKLRDKVQTLQKEKQKFEAEIQKLRKIYKYFKGK